MLQNFRGRSIYGFKSVLLLYAYLSIPMAFGSLNVSNMLIFVGYDLSAIVGGRDIFNKTARI